MAIKTLIAAYFLQTLTFISVNCQYQLNSPCTTPKGLPGRCIVVHDCPPLFRLLETENIPEDTIRFLRNSVCGYEGSDARVCCPTNLPAKCGVQSVTQRIFGGHKTKLGEHPWAALIEYKRQNENSIRTPCGGILISSRFVLTAAHCVVEEITRGYGQIHAVRLGEHDTSSNPDCEPDGEDTEICADDPISVRVNKVITHENYRHKSRNRENDIALLRLARDVTFTNYIKPVCLPTDTNPKMKLVVVGWGKTEDRRSSDEKLQVKVPLVDLRQCLQIFADTLTDGYGQMCAGGEKGKDSCSGDSGGPLMSPEIINGTETWSVNGIVSFGPRYCGTERKPGVYTHVFTFIPWIIKNMSI